MEKGQVSFETIIGMGIFLLLFTAISAYVATQNSFLFTESNQLASKNTCLVVAQAFFEAKNSKILWHGTIDHNIFAFGNTLYIDYNPPTPFEGIYCQTIDTNLNRNITKGDVNISYITGSGFIVTP